MRISELIGSRVLSLSGARICGVVCGVRLSENLSRVKAAEVFPSDDEDCERRYLDVRRIRSVGADTVTIMDESALAPDCPELASSPVNLPAYSETGEPLGRITDIILERGWAVSGLCTAEGSYALADVLSRSGELIVFRAPGSHTRCRRSRPKVPRPHAAQHESGEVRVQALSLPERYSFLLGKRLSGDVSDTSGNRIAFAGDVITAGVIADAKSRGAIVRLAAGCPDAISSVSP